MKVQKKYLLLIAGFVWIIAGLNILKLGIEAYHLYMNLINFILSLFIFGVFMRFVFYKMVIKHTYRIVSYEEEFQWFLKFFDIQSFGIMAVMMTMGISLRVFHLVPDIFIAIFYTGLGAALLSAGILFLIQFYFHIRRKLRCKQ